MSNAIISLQIGQCGNQIGFEFWKNLCEEHGITPNGFLTEFAQNLKPAYSENRGTFFYQSDDGRYVPRAALLDLEPRVINCITSSEYSKLFTTENVYMSTEGGGAGNNWAVGYSQANKLSEYFEIIERLSEDADNLDGFMLCHSMAGGTGSGVGSFVLEELVDRYPKHTIQTFSVFPHQQEMSDVVVQAYNSVLSLQRLAQYADGVVVLDNAALQHIVATNMEHENTNFHQINVQITKIMNMSTNPLRFPSFRFSGLRSLIVPLTPTNNLHFLTTSYAPWKTPAVQNMNLQRIMRDLLRPCNMVVSNPLNTHFKHGFISILDLIHSDHDSEQIMPAINYLREKQLVKFVPWAPKTMQAMLVKPSPYLSECKANTGLMISNYTGVSSLFECMLQHFDRLRERKAFLAQYQSTGVFSSNFEELDLAREVVSDLIAEYEAATFPNFKNWHPKVGSDTTLTNIPS